MLITSERGRVCQQEEGATPDIRILANGRLYDHDSAFPQAVQLPGGDILCSFCVGEAPKATDGTYYAHSPDSGLTWRPAGAVLPASEETQMSNHLKFSLSGDKKTIYAYGSRHRRTPGQVFGEYFSEPVFCRSIDKGQTWSRPQSIPIPREGEF